MIRNARPMIRKILFVAKKMKVAVHLSGGPRKIMGKSGAFQTQTILYALKIHSNVQMETPETALHVVLRVGVVEFTTGAVIMRHGALRIQKAVASLQKQTFVLKSLAEEKKIILAAIRMRFVKKTAVIHGAQFQKKIAKQKGRDIQHAGFIVVILINIVMIMVGVIKLAP